MSCLPTPSSCVRCSKTHSTPHAFLLSCSGGCSKSWHHRALYSLQTIIQSLTFIVYQPGCHQPPVSDSELIARIKAFNHNDIENGIHAWMCRRCLKHRSSLRLPQTLSTVHASDSPGPTVTSIHSSSDSVEFVIPSAPKSSATPNSTWPVQSLYVKYNLSSSWIQNRHPNIPSLPRLNKKRASRRISGSKYPPVVVQDPCNFYCISWLRERRESATSIQL